MNERLNEEFNNKYFNQLEKIRLDYEKEKKSDNPYNFNILERLSYILINVLHFIFILLVLYNITIKNITTYSILFLIIYLCLLLFYINFKHKKQKDDVKNYDSLLFYKKAYDIAILELEFYKNKYTKLYTKDKSTTK